jgi:hypothetical protein
MELVGRTRIVLAATAAIALPAVAHADDEMCKRWPAVPADHSLPVEDVMIDHLSDLGNRFGEHLDRLSHDIIGIHVDARGQRARLRLGGGNPHYLEFRVDSDWLFSEGRAHIDAKVELALAGHVLDVKLPAMDLSQDSFHGVQLVQVNVPLLERRF